LHPNSATTTTISSPNAHPNELVQTVQAEVDKIVAAAKARNVN